MNWAQAIERLHTGDCSLVSLWGEPGRAHMALIDTKSKIHLLDLLCEENRFPSVGRVHPPAIRLERAMRDLAGLEAEGSPDTRPWLRHGGPFPFLPAEGESLHQIPEGPVHAGIIEPGHFRFTANGETVARLEERLGYVLKGIDGLLTNVDMEAARRVVARQDDQLQLRAGGCIDRWRLRPIADQRHAGHRCRRLEGEGGLRRGRALRGAGPRPDAGVDDGAGQGIGPGAAARGPYGRGHGLAVRLVHQVVDCGDGVDVSMRRRDPAAEKGLHFRRVCRAGDRHADGRQRGACETAAPRAP